VTSSPNLHQTRGNAGGMELAIRFADFCREHRDDPTVAEIREHFGVSRATAYRWRCAYRDARGMTSIDKRGKTA
jgi:hypothetical protein